MSTPVIAKPAADPAAAKGGPTLGQRLTSFMPVIALVSLLAALSIADPDFFTQKSLTAAARTSSPLIVLAAGATLVVLCGGIDLSIAALASLSTVFYALWLPDVGGLTTIAVILVAAAIGAVQGVAHVLLRIPSFIVTLGGMSIFSAIALVVSDAGPVRIVDRDSTSWLTMYVAGYVPVSFAVAVAVVAGIALVLKLTPLQTWITATGYSESAARLAGTPVDLVKIGAFCVSGACAGLAAIMLVSRNFSGSPTMADNLLLPAVAAIVVGGTAITGGHGSVWRSLAGALVVSLLRVGLPIVGVPSAYEQILYGAIIVAAVALTLDRSKVLIITGVVLILIGVVGLLLGDGLLLGILNIDVVEDIVHILTGGILAYVGFGRPDIGAARTVVGALGVVYLLVGILGFILPTLLGLIPSSYSIFDNLLHLALGVLSLVVAFAQGGTTEARS